MTSPLMDKVSSASPPSSPANLITGPQESSGGDSFGKVFQQSQKHGEARELAGNNPQPQTQATTNSQCVRQESSQTNSASACAQSNLSTPATLSTAIPGISPIANNDLLGTSTSIEIASVVASIEKSSTLSPETLVPAQTDSTAAVLAAMVGMLQNPSDSQVSSTNTLPAVTLTKNKPQQELQTFTSLPSGSNTNTKDTVIAGADGVANNNNFQARIEGAWLKETVAKQSDVLENNLPSMAVTRRTNGENTENQNSGIVATSNPNLPTAFQPNLEIGTKNQIHQQVYSIAQPVGSPQFVNEVAQTMHVAIHAKLQQAEIAVTPSDMGPIRIHIQLHGNDVNLTIAVQQADTRQALEDSLPKLRELLTQSGLDLGQTAMQQQFSQSQNFGAQSSSRSGQIESSNPPSTTTTIPTVNLRQINTGQRHILDLFA